MRRGLAWLLALPLMLAGSQVAHALAYRWAYPDAPVRLHALLASGHSYLDWAPAVLGVAVAVVGLSLLVTVCDAARGRLARSLPAWAFALLPPLCFGAQECLERLLHTGVFPWHVLTEPTFLPGLVLQLPFAALAYLVGRLLLGAATSFGRALGRVEMPRSPASTPPPLLPASEVYLPRLRVLASGVTQRGPPLLLA